jgi:hypothetical protein
MVWNETLCNVGYVNERVYGYVWMWVFVPQFVNFWDVLSDKYYVLTKISRYMGMKWDALECWMGEVVGSCTPICTDLLKIGHFWDVLSDEYYEFTKNSGCNVMKWGASE